MLKITILGAMFACSGLLFGCAGSARGDLPANARVDTLQTGSIVLRGVADADPRGPNCASAELPAKHLLELKESLVGKLQLRQSLKSSEALVAVLHVKHLDSNKTWCVMTKPDGTLPTIPGEFATGVYAISVAGAHAQPYEVLFETL